MPLPRWFEGNHPLPATPPSGRPGPCSDPSANRDGTSPWLLDSYRSVNALAEATIGLYKTECVRLDGPFRTVDELELATLIWVDWFNTTGLHSSIGCIPPIEFELDDDRQNTSPATAELGELSLR